MEPSLLKKVYSSEVENHSRLEDGGRGARLQSRPSTGSRPMPLCYATFDQLVPEQVRPEGCHALWP